MKPPEVFETKRLVLRKPKMTDAETIFDEYAQDSRVSKYLSWRPHQRIEETYKFLETSLKEWESGSYFAWVITERGNDKCIGMIGFRILEFKAELGYVLTRHFWGQGIMTEAVQTIVGWLYAQPNIFRVWAVCDIENIASARVLEKVGMVKEGVLCKWASHPNISPESRDCICYSKVK